MAKKILIHYSVFLKNNECPINDIYIIDKNTPVSKGYKSVELSPHHQLVFTRNDSFLPVVRLKLTEGKVWFNSNGFQTSRRRNLYPLSDYGKCYHHLRYKAIDPRYKYIGNVREDKLFMDNGISDVVSALPNYPLNSTKEYSWNIYLNNYFFWSYHWDSHEITSRQSFMNVLEGIINVKNQNDYILETSIFHAFVMWLMLQYFFWYFTLSVFCARQNINKPMRTLFHFFAYPTKIIGLSFLIYFSYNCINSISDYQDTVISVTVSEWAPDFTTQAFFAYEESLQSVYHITYRVIVLSLLSIVAVFFDLIWELSIRGILQSTYGKLFDEYVH